MTDREKRNRAADIGDQALDLEAGPQREAFIEGQCHGEAQMAEHVRKYLTEITQVLATRQRTLMQQLKERKRPVQRRSVRLPQEPINGRYKLVRPLGVGGMGRVFEVIDLESGLPVAIKLIRGDQAINENARIRFVREARATGRLRHSNIVAIHDIGQIKGALYIVMDYVQGTPLTNLVASQSPVLLQSKLAIMAQVADALGYAHAQGIVHGDIKPDNIIVAPDHTVKVLDFGLAQQADLPNSLVQGWGTVAYMSPEQLRRREVDARSDIWSAGITLFEFLSGNLPFDSIQKILSAPPPVLPAETALASELNAILARALANDLEARYATAGEMAGDLRKLLNYTVANEAVDRAGSSQPAPRGQYILPDLNFKMPVQGELRIREVKIREVKIPKSEIRVAETKIEKFLLFIVWLLVAYTPEIDDGLMVAAMVGAPAMFVVLAARFLLNCTWKALGRQPRCPGCHRWMTRTAHWTSLVQSREEAVFGYRDCLAALEHGLWQDATKLLAIHGTNISMERMGLFITPARYRLHFYECGLCGNHAARLTSDEMVGGNWEQQSRMGEAFWGSVALQPSLLSKLAQAPQTCVLLSSELRENVRINRLSITGIIAAGLILLWLAAITWKIEF